MNEDYPGQLGPAKKKLQDQLAICLRKGCTGPVKAQVYVAIGMKESTVVGIVETMKMMTPVHAGVRGTVVEFRTGNGEFAEKVGLAMDGEKFGMGKRSQRYSMLVKDGVVEQVNVEAPGEYRASSAEYLLEQL